MRRLDVLLSHASERGNRTGPDLLIEHLERRLHGEREVVVAARTRSGAMVATDERTRPAEIPREPWKRWTIALAGFAVVVAAVALAIVLIGGGDDDVAAPGTPEQVMATLASGVEAADPDLDVLTWPVDELETNFLEWNLALGMDPEFTDCAVTASSTEWTHVRCSYVTMGEDYFFSVVQGDNAVTTVLARVTSDGTLAVAAWPPPPGLVEVERDMRAWIAATHPELEDRMFGSDYFDIRFSREAGELHTQYLEEYLAYREAHS